MKIIVTGDYCPTDRISEMLTKNDFSFFDEIKETVKGADYSIVNLECPVVNGDVTPINKCGPNLRTISRVVDSIRYAGFDCATLANNHFRDFGDEGCLATIKELEYQNVDYVGGGRNLAEAQKILYKDIDGKRLAVVNICENEFSIASERRAGAAPLDMIDNYHQITDARANADYVLLIVHGGHEHYQLPSPRMKKLYRHFVDLGVDAVVNHHQHCYSGYEYYNGKPIVYGVGNFCFDSYRNRNSIWNEGYMVEISFDSRIDTEIKLIPYCQCDAEQKISLLTEDATIRFFQNIDCINYIINDDDALNVEFERWISSRRDVVMNVFASYHNRYLNGAARRGFIPRPINVKEIAAAINFICCESHRDVTMIVLDKELSDEKN